MGKSIIPFILENPCLSNIFVEVASNKNISKIFDFQTSNIEDLKRKKYKIIIIDYSTFQQILNEKIKVHQIFLIDDSNKNNSNFKIDVDVIKINIPFKMNDIYNRIENYLIQKNTNIRRLLKYKYFTYDPSTRELSSDSFSLRFTEKESQIFLCLIENKDSHISKKDLLNKVWSYGEGIDTHTLETHVYALRKKIETKLKMKDLIMFEEKKGYYLNKSIL